MDGAGTSIGIEGEKDNLGLIFLFCTSALQEDLSETKVRVAVPHPSDKRISSRSPSRQV